MKIDIPSKHDIEQIVNLHMLAFPDCFTTKLGYNFLYEYYLFFTTSDDLTIISAKNNNIISGFICGSSDSRIIYNKLIFRSYFIIFPLILAFFKKKGMKRKMLFKSIVILTKRKVNSDVSMFGFSEIYSLAVDVNQRGKGTGSILLSEYIKIESSLGINKGCFVTTDNSQSNMKTINFYKKNNFIHHSDFIQYPVRKMAVYVYYY